jgi:hypothetical protein
MSAEHPSRYGSYRGNLVLKPLGDGRLMELVEAYTFIDRKTKEWPVPARTQTDGASIPRALWPIIGGPFEGQYRVPAIIHDYYCSLRKETWQATHAMFYEAMRASGCGELRAKVMYAGVYFGGPRWTLMDSHNVNRERRDDRGHLFRVMESRIGASWLESGLIKNTNEIGQDALIELSVGQDFSNNMAKKSNHIVMDTGKLEEMINDADPDIDEIDRAIDFAVSSLGIRQ